MHKNHHEIANQSQRQLMNAKKKQLTQPKLNTKWIEEEEVTQIKWLIFFIVFVFYLNLIQSGIVGDCKMQISYDKN